MSGPQSSRASSSGQTNHAVIPFASCQVLLQRLDEATVKEVTNPKYCKLCHNVAGDSLKYGKMHQLNKINVHYYCLLFACHLAQKGTDTQGIYGFLEADIRQEIKRAKPHKCSYCNKGGATIVCVQRMCKKVFHLPCGLKNGSQHNFYNKFQSFCKQHRPVVKIPAIYAIDIEPAICAICMEVIKRDLKCIETLWAPCCKKNSWLHRTCVQKYALSSGYFFKCPRCNDKDEFRKAMLRYGVYVPEKDASWETEGNQFGALYERYSHCDADLCMCPLGRDEDGEDTPWEIVLCGACGSQGIHVGCTKFKSALRKWYCNGCRPIVSAAAPPDACALTNSQAFNPELPGPSSRAIDSIPLEPQAENGSVAERGQAAPLTSLPLGYSRFSTDPIEIMDSEEEEEIDVEILDESINIMEVTAEGQAVSHRARRRPNYTCHRRMPRFAIIVDEDSDIAGGDSDPEFCEDVMVVA